MCLCRQNQQQNAEEQQDYSSISPVEDIEELHGYPKPNQQQLLAKAGGQSWASTADSNSDGANQHTHSLNTSDMSSRESQGGGSVGQQQQQQQQQLQQHYANHDLGEEAPRKSLFQPIAKRHDLHVESSDFRLSEMVGLVSFCWVRAGRKFGNLISDGFVEN
jgi:hypothetical protein